MARKRFTAEQVIKLREAEVGLAQGKTVGQVCKQMGVTGQTYYRWRKEYGGLRMDQAKRLKACGVDFPFATATSICLSTVTICSGLYLFIGICLVLLHGILSLQLVQISPAGSVVENHLAALNKPLINCSFPPIHIVSLPCRTDTHLVGDRAALAPRRPTGVDLVLIDPWPGRSGKGHSRVC